MQRVLVIGPGGAGKSTFARRLGAATGLPVVHLDALYWRAGWQSMPKDEWLRTVDALLAADAWVMDGNYGGTMARRIAAADTVVFLDLPRAVCLWRAVGRRIRYHGRTRPDMADGCPERLEAEFLRWIWRYPRDKRPGVLRMLEAAAPTTRVVVLRTPRQVERFLAAAEAEGGPAAPRAVSSSG